MSAETENPSGTAPLTAMLQQALNMDLAGTMFELADIWMALTPQGQADLIQSARTTLRAFTIKR